MSFRRAFIAFALCLAAAGASAWPRRRARSRSATRSPLQASPAFASTSPRRFNGIELRRRRASTFKEGTLKAVTMNYCRPQPRLGRLLAPGRPAERQARCRSWSATSRAPGWRSTAPAASCRRLTPGVEAARRSRRSPRPTGRARSIRCRRRSSVGLAGDAACDQAGADQRRQAPHRHHVHARSACEPAAATGIAGRAGRRAGLRDLHQARRPASSTTRRRKPRPSASGRSGSGSPASTRPRSAIPASSRPRPCLATIRGKLLFFRERAADPGGKPGDAAVAPGAQLRHRRCWTSMFRQRACRQCLRNYFVPCGLRCCGPHRHDHGHSLRCNCACWQRRLRISAPDSRFAARREFGHLAGYVRHRTSNVPLAGLRGSACAITSHRSGLRCCGKRCWQRRIR